MTAISEGVDASVRSAVLASYAVFIASGFAFASWASRIPQVRDRLHLDPSELGLVLLAMAAGSVIALPLSGGDHRALRFAVDCSHHGAPLRRGDGCGFARLRAGGRAGGDRAFPVRPRDRGMGR